MIASSSVTVPTVVIDTDDSVFDCLNWALVPHPEKRGKDRAQGPPSWIYLYNWPVYHGDQKEQLLTLPLLSL
jgi:hypothetical protein